MKPYATRVYVDMIVISSRLHLATIEFPDSSSLMLIPLVSLWRSAQRRVTLLSPWKPQLLATEVGYCG